MYKIVASVSALLFWSAVTVASQDAAEMTLRGEIVEVSCFSKGVKDSTGPGHVSCAKECAKKGQALGILTDGDGLVKITGDYAANKSAKLLEFIGQEVEVTGTSDRFLDYSRAIKVTKVVRLPKR
jgi:hypothetical protein